MGGVTPSTAYAIRSCSITAVESKWKQADKPDSVTALSCYDGHSSGTPVAVRLKPPTRRLRGTTSSPAYLVLLQVEIARFTQTELARLCCSDPHLTVDGCYPLPCPVESGLSSIRERTATVWPASIAIVPIVPAYNPGENNSDRRRRIHCLLADAIPASQGAEMETAFLSMQDCAGRENIPPAAHPVR